MELSWKTGAGPGNARRNRKRTLLFYEASMKHLRMLSQFRRRRYPLNLPQLSLSPRTLRCRTFQRRIAHLSRRLLWNTNKQHSYGRDQFSKERILLKPSLLILKTSHREPLRFWLISRQWQKTGGTFTVLHEDFSLPRNQMTHFSLMMNRLLNGKWRTKWLT